jgi:hypothetical protein
MTIADEYRTKAAQLYADAQVETNTAVATRLEELAMAYMRLADQADKNAATDLVYETPASKVGPEPAQQEPAAVTTKKQKA